MALNQEPAKGEAKGKNASGEALYLDNPGEGKAITYIFQREPNELTYLPGPLPAARAQNEKNTITGAGVIAMNQGTDQIWVEGPGTLTEFSSRAVSSNPGSSDLTPRMADAFTPRTTTPPDVSKPRSISLIAQNHTTDLKPQTELAESKPTTRAGRPLSEELVSTISFTEGMEFNGRSVDPAGRPAGRTDFHGFVTAQLEDALLHCEERMIAYTDRPVPLGKSRSTQETEYQWR